MGAGVHAWVRFATADGVGIDNLRPARCDKFLEAQRLADEPGAR